MSIVDDVKNVAKLVQQIDNVELYRQILDLQGEILDLVEENKALKSRIRELEEHGRRERDLVARDNVYWLPCEGAPDDGPFCTNCWDANGKLIRLIDYGNGFSGCQTCKVTVKNKWSGASREGSWGM